MSMVGLLAGGVAFPKASLIILGSIYPMSTPCQSQLIF